MTKAMATTKPQALMAKLADRFSVDPGQMVDTLKATAFRGQISNEQTTALLIVADQYGLNPWTKEIYAFPDKGSGIVPVIGVDGWSRIINQHPEFDGISFRQDGESCTCLIYRKDRNHPTEVTEYLAECRRNSPPWQSHPRRMLRHKALIQCARLAFGFVGVYDQDEAERIVERDMGAAVVVDVEPKKSRTEAVKAALKKPEPEPEPVESLAEAIIISLQSAETVEQLNEIADEAKQIADEADKERARQAYHTRKEELAAG